MSAQPPKKKMNISVLRRVFSFAAPYKKQFYGSVFLSIFLAVIAPIRPLLIQLTINNGIKNSAVGWFIKGPGGFIIEVTVIQIVLLLVETGCRFLFTFTTASLGQSVVKDLRITAYNKILHLNLSQFDKTPIGTLTTRTINDIESVNDIFSEGLIPIIADMLSIISILTYMFIADWKLTLVCLAPFPVLIIATYFFKESVNRSFIRVRNAVAALNAFRAGAYYRNEHRAGICGREKGAGKIYRHQQRAPRCEYPVHSCIFRFLPGGGAGIRAFRRAAGLVGGHGGGRLGCEGGSGRRHHHFVYSLP